MPFLYLKFFIGSSLFQILHESFSLSMFSYPHKHISLCPALGVDTNENGRRWGNGEGG
jgi:hypothetical protein